MGMCHQESWNLDDAERCFRKALQLETSPKEEAYALNNLGLVYINRCMPKKALEYIDRAIALKDMREARENKGLAHLMLQDWKAGWENWKYSTGGQYRREIVYGNETRWDGSKGKVVIAFGEQGLGDEISFGSCIPDLIKDSKKVIVDCDKKLAGLFQRSFPEADVYGTRFKNKVEFPKDYGIEHRVAFGDLPGFYRNAASEFPGKPYLVADPERRIQWEALLDSLGPEPKIGVSFTGGLLSTGYKKRSLSLEAFLPILKEKAHFVSLQYKEVPDYAEFERMYGIKIHHWPRAVETKDYDDTAALVAELDCVISVTTAVIHLAGALGVPALVLTPSKPRWFYGLEGDSVPWYSSVKLFRQQGQDWQSVIEKVAHCRQSTT